MLISLTEKILFFFFFFKQFQIAAHNQDLLEENLNLQCSCEQVMSMHENMDSYPTVRMGNCFLCSLCEFLVMFHVTAIRPLVLTLWRNIGI